MIVITAPTGNIGSKVLSNVLEHTGKVRVIARNPAKLSVEMRQRVEIIEGSHRDPEIVARAFDGADTVFWLMTGDPTAPSAETAYVDFSKPGCRALKASGVKRVVGVSALGRGWPKDAGHVTASLKLDDMIAETGVGYRALACGALMENMLRQVISIRDRGVFYGTSPADFRIPTVASLDVAAVASRLLLDSSWTGIGSVPLMGPEDISFDDMAKITSEILEKPVAYQQISMSERKTMMTGRGATDGIAQAMVNMLTAINEGMNHMIARTNASDTPTSFNRWCELVLKPAVMT